MKPAVVATAAALVCLTACGASASTPVSTTHPSVSPSRTSLPPLETGMKGSVVIVPLTVRSGSWQFRPTRAYRGKLLVEYACVGPGTFRLAFAGTEVTERCDAKPYMFGDDSAVLTTSTNITVTADPRARWHLIGTANR